MQFWIDLLTSPTVLIATFVIGALGEAVKRLVNAFRVQPQYDEHGHIVYPKQADGKVITYRDSHGKEIAPPDPMWIRIFDATLPAQPVVVGLLLGCIPWLPAEASVVKEHYEFAGHLATYGAAGIFCKVGYDILVTTFRRFISTKANQIVRTIDPSTAVVTTTTTTTVAPSDSTVSTDSSAPATDPNPSTDSTPTV